MATPPQPAAELLAAAAPIIDWSEYNVAVVDARVPAPPPAGAGVTTSGVTTSDVTAPRVSLRAHIEGVEAIADTIESLDDESLSDDERDELSAMLISAIAGTKRKVDATANVFAMFETLEAGAKAEKERLAKREAFYARQIARLTEYVTITMRTSSLDRLDGETSTLALRKNPPSVVIEPGARLDDEWLVYPDAPPPRADKAAIGRALKAGFQIAGAALAQTTRLVRS